MSPLLPTPRPCSTMVRYDRRAVLRALASVAALFARAASAKIMCKNRSCCNGRCVDPADRGQKRN
ncbi:MAG: hypothetical protein U0031_06800 [Thermomicrobiales bacterium]